MNRLTTKLILCAMVLGFVAPLSYAQKQKPAEKQSYKRVIVGFYNLENLFDTIDDPDKNDEEFLPDGKNRWNTEKYTTKLKNMSHAISTIGTDYTPDGVAVLGLSEMENRHVLEDLVSQPSIKDRNYKIVHYNSPDRRGVDVALIYNPKYFKVKHTDSYRTVVPGQPNFITRDQLLVSGLLDGEEMHFIVGHWPSRYGGEKRSLPGRQAAAALSRHIADSIMAINPNAKIVIMGDFNDTPENKSVIETLRAKGNLEKLQEGEFFNTMYELNSKGIGSNAYHDAWSILDQIVITPGLFPQGYETYEYRFSKVHNKEELKQHSGRYDGYPWRTFAGGVWLGGYSDHFPTYICLQKKYNGKRK